MPSTICSHSKIKINQQHIFFKEIDLDNKNRSAVNLTRNNTIKEVKFFLHRNYYVRNLKINEKVETDMT